MGSWDKKGSCGWREGGCAELGAKLNSAFAQLKPLMDLLLLLLLLLAIILLILYLRARGRAIRAERELQQLRAEFSARVFEQARALFQSWREQELARERVQLEEVFRAQFEAWKQEWIQQYEEEIRRDAVARSAATLAGKIGEHLAPLFIFGQYGIDPRDLRFLGTPVDFIAFKGLSQGDPQEIIFIEVKTGKTVSFTPKEKAPRKLVEERKVSWITFHLKQELDKLVKDVQEQVKTDAGKRAGFEGHKPVPKA